MTDDITNETPRVRIYTSDVNEIHRAVRAMFPNKFYIVTTSTSQVPEDNFIEIIINISKEEESLLRLVV